MRNRWAVLRSGIELIIAVLMIAYGALAAAWQVSSAGDPALEPLITDLIDIPLAVVAIAFALLAARRAPTAAARRAWLLIGLAFGAFGFGDVAWTYLEIVLEVEPFPSIADAGYLAFYPLLLLGLLAIPRERPENPQRRLLDVAIVVVGSGTVVWWLVLEPVSAASTGLESLIALGYPVGDLLILFALAAALMSRLVGTSRAALALLGVGIILNVVADLVFARLSLEEAYESGAWVDVAWTVGWIAMSLAGFVQARSMAAARKTGAPPALIRPISFPPYLAVAAVYGLLVVATEMPGASLRVVVGGAIAVTGLVVVRQVLTARENARLLEERARSAARFQAIIQNASDGIVVVDREGTITYVSPSVSRLVDRPVESLLGLGLDTLLEPNDVPLAFELLRTAAIRPGTSDTIQCRVPAPADEPRHVELDVMNLLGDPDVASLVVTIHDVTERRAFEQQLRDQALHDPLTGLANRALLDDRISQALRRGRRNGTVPALLYLDLDDFKTINDSLGHPVGDHVLVEIARRLGNTIRAEDTAARLGGDEFAVLIDETRSDDEVVAVAERLLSALCPPIEVGGTAVLVGASVGIARPEGRGTESMELLRDADIAMYEAKREARGGHRVFEKAMFAATVERVGLEADLRVALAGGQFELAYQPLFEIAENRMVGVEALLRWNHPVRGRVMPMQFIPVAERTGEIIRIGCWVIEQTCRTVRGWNEAGAGRRLRANVHVSPRQLEPRLVQDVDEILRRTGFPAELLVLEITEGVFVADRPGVLHVLAALRALGVRVSIDDLGTGYSSLSVLRDLPIDEIKIDRSFIKALANHGDAGLVGAIIRLGHSLGLAVVAEGIELEEQIDSLCALDCDIGQGFRLGRPVSASAIEHLLGSEAGASAGRLARTA